MECGFTYVARYKVINGRLHLDHPDLGSKAATVGRFPFSSVARLLLAEMVREARYGEVDAA